MTFFSRCSLSRWRNIAVLFVYILYRAHMSPLQHTFAFSYTYYYNIIQLLLLCGRAFCLLLRQPCRVRIPSWWLHVPFFVRSARTRLSATTIKYIIISAVRITRRCAYNMMMYATIEHAALVDRVQKYDKIKKKKRHAPKAEPESVLYTFCVFYVPTHIIMYTSYIILLL